MSQDWRTEITALDYFGHQKKVLQVADRRPVIRQASDLVGPGIDATAVRISDFNDQLATYNGFYAAVTGTLNAPTSVSPFVVFVSSDAELGGVQIATALDTNVSYRRCFTRSPSDPDTLFWTAWV